MKYYTIQNGSILTSDNKAVLEKFYNEAFELPLDYEEGKYAVVDGNLELVEGFDEEKLKRERKEEIILRLNEIDQKSIRAIRSNDTDYIQAYENEAESLREELRGLNDNN